MQKNRIKLLFAGDFCSEFPGKIELSQNILDLFNTCDFKFLNFEGPLAKGKLNIPNKTVLPQSSLSPRWCEENGFNIISLANNHSLDYSDEGLLSTKESFKKSITLGAGDWTEAYKIKFLSCGGVRLGFIAGTSYDFASLKDKWTDIDKIGCAWINSAEINKQISENKDKCDYLFVISHGGLEYMNVPLPEWRDRYRELIDLGADAIIATHPHIPQGIEIYKSKPIFYSLGNFYFDTLGNNKPKYWDNGLLAVIEIMNDIIHYEVIPTVRNENTIDIDESKEMKQHISDITSILHDYEKYMEHVNTGVLKFYPKYQQWLLSGFNAIEMKFNLHTILRIIYRMTFASFKPNLKIAMHQMREDSTRWALTRALKIMTKSNV
jgi:poly-gamma-glutamate synthesis protein (capsule biosynthesis protein)